jgi:SPX domain protein involved in polyphosphate accumulation
MTHKSSKPKKIKITDAWSEKISKNDKHDLSHRRWHKIENTQKLYLNILKIGFGNYIDKLIIPIENRHHIVHRNGKNRDGEVLNLKKKDLTDLIKVTKSFVKYLKKRIDEKIHDEDAKKVDKIFIEDDSPF